MAPGNFLKRLNPKKRTAKSDDGQASTPPKPATPTRRPLATSASAPLLSLDIPSASLVTPPSSRATGGGTLGAKSVLTIGHDVDLGLHDDESDTTDTPWVDLGRRPQAGSTPLSSGRLSRADRTRIHRARLSPSQTEQIVRLCGGVIKERGLETLGLMRPWRLAEDQLEIAQLQLVLLDHLQPSPAPVDGPAPAKVKTVTAEDVKDELVFSSVSNVAAVLKWAIRHVAYPSSDPFLSPNPKWYSTFAATDAANKYPASAYENLLGPQISPEAKKLLDTSLDLLAAVSAHAEQNAMPASRFCRALGFWLLGRSSSQYASFAELYAAWDTAGKQLEHIFGAWLRAQDKAGNGGLPRRLKELIRLGKPDAATTSPSPSSSSSSLGGPPPTATKRVEAAKVTVETEADVEMPSSPRPSEATDAGTQTGGLRRLGSATKARKSKAVATGEPSALPTVDQLARSRTPVDVVLAALNADRTVPSGGGGEAGKTWEVIVSTAGEGEVKNRFAIGSALADETVRVLDLAFPPVAPSPRRTTSDASSSSTPSGSKVPRRRSFSLDTAKSRKPTHLGTLYEDSSAAGNASPPSWTDFVAGGFSETSPDLNVKLLGMTDAPTTSSGAAASSRSFMPGLGRSSSKNSRLASASEENLAPAKPSSEEQGKRKQVPVTTKGSKLVGVQSVTIDESFADFWLDSLAEKAMWIGTTTGGTGGGEGGIGSGWPVFVVSGLQHALADGRGGVLGHVVIEERFVAAQASHFEESGEQGEPLARAVSPTPSTGTTATEKKRRRSDIAGTLKRLSRRKSAKPEPSLPTPPGPAKPVAAAPTTATATRATPEPKAAPAQPVGEIEEAGDGEAAGGPGGLATSNASPVLPAAPAHESEAGDVAEPAAAAPDEAPREKQAVEEESKRQAEIEAEAKAREERELAAAKEAEAAKLAAEQEAARQQAEREAAEAAAAEAARKKQEEEAAKKKAEEEAARKAEEEARLRAEEEAQKQREAELAAAAAAEEARLAAERAAREKREAEEAAEQRRLEAERQETERQEAERREAERLEAERKEAERQEAAQIEVQRAEAERAEAERVEQERAASDGGGAEGVTGDEQAAPEGPAGQDRSEAPVPAVETDQDEPDQERAASTTDPVPSNVAMPTPSSPAVETREPASAAPSDETKTEIASTASTAAPTDAVAFPAATPMTPQSSRSTRSKPPSSASGRKSLLSKAGSRIKSMTRSRSKSRDSTAKAPAAADAASAPPTPTPARKPSTPTTPTSPAKDGPSDDVQDILAKARAKRAKSSGAASLPETPAQPTSPATAEHPQPSGERTPKVSGATLNGESSATPVRSSDPGETRPTSPSGTAFTAATASSPIRESFDTARSN